jgi:hypothetical protein
MHSAWFALVSVVALGGCYATARTEPAYVETTGATVEYDAYPHTVYEGRTVYYVGNRWGWRERGGWRYYDSEPVQLRRHRETYVRRAPTRYEERRHEERREERHEDRREEHRR